MSNPQLTHVSNGTQVSVSEAPLANTTYYWRVYAYNSVSGLRTAYSSRQQFTTTAPDTTNPTITITSPAANGTTVTNSTLSISGTATDNIGLTQVRYALNNGSSVQASLSGTSWSGTVTLAAGLNTIYAYSQDTSGNTSATITRTVTYSPPPGVPMSLPASFINSSGFTANWNKGSSATGHYLDVSTSNGFGTFVSGLNGLDVGDTDSKSISGLSPGYTYYYRVRSYNLSGTSGNSTIISATLTNTPPTITNISEQTISLNASTTALPFSIDDAELSGGLLTLGKNSSNQTLVPLANIVFGGSGNNRNVTVTPASGQIGQSIITISVSDGVTTTTTSFLLQVSNNNANLASLTFDSWSLNPAFAPSTTSYAITVPNVASTATVAPTLADANATLKINDISAASGAGTAVPLNVGNNTISLLVTAQDGTTTRTYTLNVRRRSTDATLASLSLSSVTLSPSFAAETTGYTASVPFLTTNTTVTATTTHGSAAVTSGMGLRNLVVGANALSVLVTAEDGNTLTLKA